MLLLVTSALFFLTTSISFSQDKTLKDHILFYSSFDGKLSADISVGDPSIYTAENYKKTTTAQPGLHSTDIALAKNKGLNGDALQFKKAKTAALYYNGFKNLGYSATSWSGSVSFWLQVDPDKELAPGYCDPICITDVRYNDAALWVDFTDHTPRQFRFGAMGDLEVWNPENKNDETKWKKRTVTVMEPPFESGKWTQIVMTYSEVNTNKSVCTLYVDGQYKGVIKDVNDPFTWEEEKAKIMLGLGYIGMMDELAVFDIPLDPKQVLFVFELKKGIKTLFK